jgi:MFS family permease
MILLVAPLSFAVIRTHRPGRSAVRADDEEDAPGFELREAIATRSFWMLVIAYICWGYSFGAPFTQLVSYLIGLGYQPGSAALAFSMMMGVAIIGELTFGWAADRFGARQVATVIFTITAIIQIVLLGAAHVATLVIFVVINGLVIESAMVVLPIVLADSMGVKRFGSINGLLWLPLCLGVATGPLISGKIFDVTGSYVHAFQVSAAIAMIGAIAAFSTVVGNFAVSNEALPGEIRA